MIEKKILGKLEDPVLYQKGEYPVHLMGYASSITLLSIFLTS